MSRLLGFISSADHIIQIDSMKKLFTSMACALALCVGGTAAWAASAPSRVSIPVPSYDKGINIIPRPKQLQELKLPAFRLTATTPVIASGDSAVTIARFFTERLTALWASLCV